MVEESRPRLGRGLAALIGDAGSEPGERERGQRRIPIEFLRANPRNPRKTFDSNSLDELTESVREKGVVQPIVVRELPGQPGTFEIIAGERRWRAAQRASLHTVPVVVIEATDRESLELAIIENVQRSDLNALEEADGYAQLIQEFGYSHADLGRVIGKSRSHVANTLRLVGLAGSIKKLVMDGSLSAGHARALLSISDPEPLARRIVAQGLSVREVEKIVHDQVSQSADSNVGPAVGKSEKAADIKVLEKSLQEALGLSVEIAHRGAGGEIRLRYKTMEQLDLICHKLSSEHFK